MFIVITDCLIIIFRTSEELIVSRIIIWPTMIFLCALASSFLYTISSNKLSRILKLVINFVCLSAILQSLAYILFGIKIDYIAPFTGEMSRNIAPGANFISSHLAGFRASGIFSEPGNLGTTLSFLYFIFKLTNHDGRYKQSILTTSALVYITFLLTFSLFTVAWMVIHLIDDIINIKMPKLVRVLIFATASILFIPIFNYALFRLSDPVLALAALAQIVGLFELIRSLDFLQLTLGLTHFKDLRAISDIVLSDGSFVLYELVRMGAFRHILFYTIILVIFFKIKRKISFLCFVAALSAGKFSFSNYWLIYLLFMYLNVLFIQEKAKWKTG